MLDLFGSNYVLLSSNPSGATSQAARQLADNGFPIETVELANLPQLTTMYESGEDVLVRPDGYVAARIESGGHVDLHDLLARVA